MDYTDFIYSTANKEPQPKKKQQQEEGFNLNKKIAENILKSERMRAEINKAITRGDEAHSVLLKALECIYLMTGDELFYNTNKEKLEKGQI